MLGSQLVKKGMKMTKSSTEHKAIDWDSLELEAFNLRFERLTPEQKTKRARELAAKFQKYNQPMPRELANLIRGKTMKRRSATRRKLTPLEQYLLNPSLLEKKKR